MKIDWTKTIASVGVSVATIAGLYITKDGSCLWALLFIPILFKAI